MTSAFADAGPPLLTLLITIFVMVAIANRRAVRDFWEDVFRGSHR